MHNTNNAGTVDYINARLGTPWEREGLHCWQLVVETQRDLFGRELPAVLASPDTPTRTRRFRDDAERVRWRETITAAHGAIVLMHRAGTDPRMLIHAGTWLDVDGGGVLHCDEPHGVVFDSAATLRNVRRWVAHFFVPRGAR